MALKLFRFLNAPPPPPQKKEKKTGQPQIFRCLKMYLALHIHWLGIWAATEFF
jgi:hypothetical protein